METMEGVLYKLFLSLWKNYYSLDKEQCLDILVGYGIGLRKERVIWIYGGHLLMVDQEGRYYRYLFNG